MKATGAVLRENGGPFLLEDIDLDGPGPGEVLVRMVSVGVCRTDLEFAKFWMTPALLGHEGAGVVEQVGVGVIGLAVGDHVIMSFRSCHACPACEHGEPSYCRHFDDVNFSGARPDGSTAVHDSTGAPLHAHFLGQSSFATHAVVPAASAVRVDPSLDLNVVGALGCGLQTGAGTILNVLRSRPGHAVAVFGVGTVGMAAVMAAKIAGCHPIVAVDVSPARRDLACALGASHAIDALSPTIVDDLHALATHGYDATVDTTGRADVVSNAVSILHRRGTCAVVGVGPDERISIDWRTLFNGRTVTGVVGGASLPQVFIPQLIELYQRGVFPIDRLVTTFPFADIQIAIGAMERGEVIKAVLTF
jgi:aryl-alcohol dehydrogenase